MLRSSIRHPGHSAEAAHLLSRYADAWNARDIGAIMALHRPETEYEWHGHGLRHVGIDAVRKIFTAQIAAMPDMSFDLRTSYCHAGSIVFESTISGTVKGQRLVYESIDVLTLDEGRIIHKDTYTTPVRSPA